MSNKLIYVADDDSDVLELYKNIFNSETGLSFFEEMEKENAFTLKCFEDGKYLLQELQEDYKQGKRIPLCILDMRMPLMNGYNTAQEIRKLDSDVIFIFSSAHSDISANTLRENLKQDIYHIRKPFNQEELYGLVDSLMKSWNQRMLLKQQNEKLESLVEERTLQYKKANEELQIQIIEKEKSQKEMFALQKQLHQAAKMEAIGTLAGGIAHDFNNILGVIMGYAELSLHKIEGYEALKNYLSKILDACEHAKSLIRKILIFSRKEGEEQKNINIAKIVDDAVELIRASLPANIEIRKKLETISQNILGNPTEIQQILMNLTTNASYAMKEKGGILEVILKESQKENEDFNEYLELIISDTGQGMNAETLQRIFEPYFSTKPLGEGTGLGLSMVHGIVKKHRGHIIVESEEGKGTKFHLFFPKMGKNITQKINIGKPVSKGHGRFLLVDDKEDMIDLSKEMLEWLGYCVISFKDSLEAWKAFSCSPHEFDFVLTDQTMPAMSGCELAKAITQIRPDIPIILCSGYGESITEERLKSSGIKAFLAKPITIKELSDTILKLTRRIG
ncbi:MAG: response regulator [Candidatus Brocadiae bacterium]|nr:response regulator [Candidatus Brocadiia bacterium]